MRKVFSILVVLILAASFSLQEFVLAQNSTGRNPNNYFEPISVTGTVVVDSAKKIKRYFLDIDNNGTKEYELSFGPKWYTPTTGAQKPNSGDAVSITGDLFSKTKIPLIVVYTINGMKWRDSVGTRSIRNKFDPDSIRKNFSPWANRFGWSVKDSLTPVSLTGKAVVDSFSLHHKVFYLDELSDGTKDYILMFGPWWYQPKSGAERPNDGDAVSIKGGLFQKDPLLPKIVIVQELNGLAWIDSIGKFPWPGKTIKRDAGNSSIVRSVYNPNTYCQFYSNSFGNMFGHLFPSELYASISEIDPVDLPVTASDNIVAAFSINITDDIMKGLFMPFDKNIVFNLSFKESVLSLGKYNKRNLQIKYLGDDNELYNVSNAKFDYSNNSVNFSQSLINGTYVLEAIEPETPNLVKESVIPEQVKLQQNYPNPFNPETRITFELPEKGNVKLTIYDIIGSEIKSLINNDLDKGVYHVTWNGKDNSGKHAASGVYIYKLEFNGSVITRKMNLIK